MFFDVYSSPILRCLNILNATPCSIEWNHQSDYTLLLSKRETNLEINKSNSHRIYSTVIDGQAIAFTFSGEVGNTVNVDFTVNHSFTRKELPKRTKLSITRWLLAVWKLECTNYTIYIAIPSGDVDSEGSQWRGGYYSKFGFQWVDGKRMELIVK